MDVDEQIGQFLESESFAVAGASKNPDKFRNTIFKCYLSKGYRVIPVNLVEQPIAGVDCVAAVADLPKEVIDLSVVTPPAITEKLVREAVKKGIRNIWLQPGTWSDDALLLISLPGLHSIQEN